MERIRPSRIGLSLFGEQRGSVNLLDGDGSTTLGAVLANVLDAETSSLTQRRSYVISAAGGHNNSLLAFPEYKGVVASTPAFASHDAAPDRFPTFPTRCFNSCFNPKKERTNMTTENAMAPTDEMIAARAYDRYLQRGCEDGCDMEDWLAAEGELRAELAAQAGAETGPAQRTPRARTTQSAATTARS